MLLLVYTVVSAQQAGWGLGQDHRLVRRPSPRLFGVFVAIERRSPRPGWLPFRHLRLAGPAARQTSARVTLFGS